MHARTAALTTAVITAIAAPAVAGARIRTAAHHHHAHHHAKHPARKKRHRTHHHVVAHAPAILVPGLPPLYRTFADTAAPTATDRPLTPGDFRYWKGATVAAGDVLDPSHCGLTGPCFSWKLPVGPGGTRLRVALDTPMRSNSFKTVVTDPSGATSSNTNSNAFDAEIFDSKPAAGVWTILVMPQNVSNASFRMRAKLEGPPTPPPHTKTALLPDLAADPPTEFTFVAPANPANGAYPPDTVNPPLDVLGMHPLTCTADEMAPTDVQGGAATKCLRFTSGPMNIGAGPYEMHWTYAQDIVGGQIQSPIAHGPMFQTIHYSDGSKTTRPAGTYSYHVTHAHFHDDGVLSMKLFSVSEPGDRLSQVGAGTKSGFCPANQLLGNWRSFDNEAPDAGIGSGDVGAGNCQDPENGVLGLSPGWGDVYRWQRPGMYVEFGSNPDGLYVVQITINAAHDVLESNYSNNTAYALVKVTGDQVAEIERGQGDSPWDPSKVVFSGSGPASRD